MLNYIARIKKYVQFGDVEFYRNFSCRKRRKQKKKKEKRKLDKIIEIENDCKCE